MSDACLVTGATGFIGGHVARRLAEEGRPVRCLVRRSSDTSRLEALDVEVVVGDLADPASLARAVRGCDAVCHCAAMVSDWGTVAEIRRVNVAGTRDLAEAAAAASVRRFVYLSTTDVYGHPGVEVDESHLPTGFANWYAQTKREAEAEVGRAAAGSSLETVVLRPATVYGPGSVEVVGAIARAIRARTMMLVGGGRAVAGLVYVDDVVDAVVLALDRDAAPGATLNLSGGLDVTWRALTDDLAAGLGCPPVRWRLPYGLASGLALGLETGYRHLRRTTGISMRPLLSRQAVQVLGRDQSFANARAREVLGWTPRTDYASGLAATVAWLRAEIDSARQR